MSLFKKKKDKVYTIVIGCGRLGAGIANTLSDDGGSVLIMDKDKDAFRKLSLSYGGLSVTGDGTDFDDLRDAEIKKADVAIAVTNNDNTNIMIAQIAREVFHVPHIIARLSDPEYECVYRKLGIDTICPFILSENEIGKLLSNALKEKTEVV